MKKTLSIEGMTCQNCARHVTEALHGIEGVSSVSIDLPGKKAELEATESVSNEALENAVKEVGYEVMSVGGE